MAQKVIIAAILVSYAIFNFIQTASSLQCYSCTASLGNGFRCENLSLSGGSVPYNTCFYGDAVCAKYVIEYGDSLMIHRSCQHRDICHVLASKYNNYFSNLLDCQTCWDKDFCNGGSVAKFVPFLLFLPIFLYFTIL